MVWAWMLWATVRTRVWMLSRSPHGCSAKNAMRGGNNNVEALGALEVLFVPRRPVPMESGGKASFAR